MLITTENHGAGDTFDVYDDGKAAISIIPSSEHLHLGLPRLGMVYLVKNSDDQLHADVSIRFRMDVPSATTALEALVNLLYKSYDIKKTGH